MKTVAPDACVFIEAVRSQTITTNPARSSLNPSHRLLVLAEYRVFALMLLPLVMQQVEDNLHPAELEILGARLAKCHCMTVPLVTAAEIDAVYKRYPLIQSTVRDVDDWAIAATVYLARPDYFVSGNDADFNAKLDEHLQGTQVVTPKLLVRRVDRAMRDASIF